MVLVDLCLLTVIFRFRRFNKQTMWDSLETQLKQIGSYASLRGFELPDENYITEQGGSGSIEFEMLPEGSKLFDRLKEGDTLLFNKLDRAFRNTRNALNTIHDLEEGGGFGSLHRSRWRRN
jgi:DNA invertase Pin-like site-specific DNA recombinase